MNEVAKSNSYDLTKVECGGLTSNQWRYERLWADRVPDEAITYGSKMGSPIERYVELANLLDMNMWVTIPMVCGTDYSAGMAAYILANLNDHLHLAVEFCNESWNGSFHSFRVVFDQSLEMWGHPNAPTVLDADVNTNFHMYYAWKSGEIMDTFEDAGWPLARLHRVLGSQAANSGITTSRLKAQTPTVQSRHDAVAIAPYFGHNMLRNTTTGVSSNDISTRHPGYSTWEEWTLDQDVDTLFDELRDYFIPGNTEADITAQLSALETDGNGLKLYTYEGGSHVEDAGTAVIDAATINALEVTLAFHPRMAELYEQYFGILYTLNPGQVSIFNAHIDDTSIWATWASYADALDPFGDISTSPKMQGFLAFMDIIDAPYSASRASPRNRASVIGIGMPF